MGFFTADLCDSFENEVDILGPGYISYGGVKKFRGRAVTVKLDKNNKTLKELLLNENGVGKVVIVDVDMKYVAVVGDNLMKFASDNKYEGIIVNGYVRDTVATKEFTVGLFAKGTCPKRHTPIQEGQLNQRLYLDGATIENGDFVYADEDGIVISKKNLL